MEFQLRTRKHCEYLHNSSKLALCREFEHHRLRDVIAAQQPQVPCVLLTQRNAVCLLRAQTMRVVGLKKSGVIMCCRETL